MWKARCPPQSGHEENDWRYQWKGQWTHRAKAVNASEELDFLLCAKGEPQFFQSKRIGFLKRTSGSFAENILERETSGQLEMSLGALTTVQAREDKAQNWGYSGKRWDTLHTEVLHQCFSDLWNTEMKLGIFAVHRSASTAVILPCFPVNLHNASRRWILWSRF